MVSSLRRSKRTVGRRIIDMQSRVTRLQRRPAPRRLGANAVTSGTIAPGAVPPAALDPGIISGINSDINFAQATADGKNRVFYAPGSSIPTSSAAGDLWFNTTENYKMYRAAAAGVNTIGAGAWVGFTLGNDALASISADKITAGTIDASVITVSNIDAGEITSGTISSARITTESISAASIDADNITAGTISGITVEASSGGQGIRITTSGYIQGLGGDGVRVANSDGSTDNTRLFKNEIFTGKFDGTEFLASDGLSSFQILRTTSNFKRYTDDTGAVLNIYRRSWTGDGNPKNGDSRSDNAALIAFYKEGAGSSFAAMRYVAGADPGSVQLQNISDARLKVEVSAADSSLSIINSLQPKHFRWANHDEDRVSYGLYAQELHSILPHAVYVGDSAESAKVNNETGQYEVDDPWMMDYTSIVPYLIGAVKELSARVAELESK